ncbi:glycosyltransferase family 4 protein [Nocardioides zhouii]|uniref:Glycosyltransferase n=1 Tax=Nocardioides zhouii TaxID=1168729 RepID=A0A4V1RNH2_9ACTN|nr:glycosyltransferase family 4 protein [Nocardioides zhouii]RYC05847.1 glycosyltransferase [Nocardioides zhouii]
MADRIHLAANNPDLGGGEMMLLRHAEALLQLGHPVTVVAPDSPTEVLDAAAAAGAEVVAIRATGRRDYLPRLRAWDREQRRGVLWCHGLVPSFATSGRPDRIVHLHQAPRGRAQELAVVVARRGALATVVPSHDAASRIPGSTPHANWTQELPRLPLRPGPVSGSATVGYLGRLSTDKGVDVLARAVAAVPHDVRLLLAGDTRYVEAESVATVDAAVGALGDRAVRLGHVAPADLFQQVDLVVFPSVWAEPFGLVVAEAMAAGVPFVVSDAGALPEVAGPDHPWVARAGDAGDLARVITRALAVSADERQAVTDRARSRWGGQYSPQAGRRRVHHLLDDLGVR